VVIVLNPRTLSPALRGPRLRVAAGVLPLLLLVVVAGSLAAQATGTLSGTVVAEESGAPLPEVTVRLTGTDRGTTTDARGRYELTGLRPGEYRIEASILGRRPGSAGATVMAGRGVTADLALAPGPLLLPGVVVSATRVPRPAERVAATVHVLTREEVRSAPGRTPDDVVRLMPGVELPRVSGTVSGPEQIVSIRGTDEGRTLVLLDDVPLNDPWGEWVDWGRAPVHSIDRIEVAEGGGSSLYGNYAMGGVIQLVSRPIEPDAVHFLGTAGSRDLYELSAMGSDVRGPLAFSADGTLASGGGYVLAAVPGEVDVASASTRRNANARAEYALGADRTLSVRASLLDEDRDAGTPLSGSSRTIGGGSVGVDLGGVAAGRLRGTLFGNVQRSVSRQTVVAAGRASETPALEQTIPAHDVGGTVVWSRPGGGFLDMLSVGGDFRSMVGRLEEDVFSDGSVAQTRSSGGSQLVGGVFVQGVFAPVERLSVEASARVDGWRNSAGSRAVSDSAALEYDARSDVAFAPRLGVRLETLPGLTLRGSVYRAFRAPTLSEQFRTFVSGSNTFLPNADLGPEHLTGADLGFDWAPAAQLELRATVFDNEMEDLTSFAFLKPGYLMRQNVGKAHSRGVEAEAALRPAEWLRLIASYNYDEAETEEGARVARVPLQRFVGRATLAKRGLGDLSLAYRHEGTMAALGGAVLPPFDVLDLDARRTLFAGTRLFVSVENLTDAHYVANRSGTLEQLGLPRTVRVGFTVEER
jgi:outer membrane receptor protein involved in Fe transport